MDQARSVVRTLCWTLIVASVIGAVVGLMYTFGILRPEVPDNPDSIEFLLSLRAEDAKAFPFDVLWSLASLFAYVIAVTFGVVLRRWSEPSPARDGMTALLVTGGTIGAITQLVSIGVAEFATQDYCDCLLKAESVIAQDFALSLGWGVVSWLSIGGSTLVGLGVALAGRVVEVSGTWRTLSTAIAALLLVASAVNLFRTFVFIPLDLDISNLITLFVSGLLVPIWAFLLARRLEPEPESEPAT